MLINALCEYSDYLKGKGGDVIPDCLSAQDVSFVIFLTPEGEISGIQSIREEVEIPQKNNKVKKVLKPVSAILPKRTQKTCVCANIIEHRPLYIFGLNLEKEGFTPEDKTGKAKKSHEAFVKENLAFCEGMESEIVKAYRNFLERWKPEEQCQNKELLSIGKDYSGSYFCFALDGHPEIKLHEDKELMGKYIAENSGNEDGDEGGVSAMCAVEGKVLPIARIHEKIKGIAGGNSTGGALVMYNDTAFESYGKTQSYNSNISQRAMKKYTSALNYLLSDKKHHIYLEDTTIVFFAMSKDDSEECDLFMSLLEGNADEKTDNALKAVMEQAKQGKAADAAEINEDVIFYIAGFTPNSSRICQKFIVRDKFGNILKNIEQHQLDMAVREGGQVGTYWILKELISPKSSNEKVPSPLSSALFYSILNGTKYPDSLLSTVIRRIKTDNDTDKSRFVKLNDTRIGIIKACLNRKARLSGKQEEIKMALDTENKNPAYLCGRLFAALEMAQRNAAGTELNTTIKDRYFSSACPRPSSVFPTLLKLAQHHLSKKNHIGVQKAISQVMELLDSDFPSTLSLDEQGKFIIGYYQQNNAFYTKKETE